MATMLDCNRTLCDGGQHVWTARDRCSNCDLQVGSFVNLTPHSVDIHTVDREGLTVILTIPPSGVVARVEQTTTEIYGGEVYVKGHGYVRIPMAQATSGAVVGVPEYRRVHHVNRHGDSDAISPEFVYIVSRAVAQHNTMRGRCDIVVPGKPVLDSDGHVVGTVGLLRLEATYGQQEAALAAAVWA